MSDPVKKAIDSIGKKRYPAIEADKKLAKMTPKELAIRREVIKNSKIRPGDFVK